MKIGKTIKVYSVTFIEYTDVLKEAVYSEEDKEYLNLDNKYGSLLIREDELEKYSKYGKGFKELNLVGYIIIDQ